MGTAAIRGYEVRLRQGAGRRTVRVAAVSAPEARAQAVGRFGGEAIRCQRSKYAIGARERADRVDWQAKRGGV